jgi:hypothetical protein
VIVETLTAEHRCALAVLASSSAGMSKLLFLARGFSAEMDLLQAGLVSVEERQTRVHGRQLLVRRLRITDTRPTGAARYAWGRDHNTTHTPARVRLKGWRYKYTAEAQIPTVLGD